MLQKLTNYYLLMIIKHLSEHKTFWLVSAIGWTIFVAFLCLVNNNDLPSIGMKISGIDKVIHFLFHFIFTLLWSIYYFSKDKMLTPKRVIIIVIASLIFGVMIEWMQASFTLTRQADVLDVISNTGGAISSGLLVYHLLKKHFHSNT